MTVLMYHIRIASSLKEDGKQILKFCDSNLAWLKDIGSEEQWGTDPYGPDPENQDLYRSIVEKSAINQTKPWGTDWTYAAIAEANIPDSSHSGIMDDDKRVPVAAMLLDGRSPDSVRACLPEQDDQDPFVYISYLVTDYSAREISKGAGSALLSHAEDIAKRFNLRKLCLDCWRGNDRRLVRYYERHGFVLLGDLEKESGWKTAVMEKSIV